MSSYYHYSSDSNSDTAARVLWKFPWNLFPLLQLIVFQNSFSTHHVPLHVDAMQCLLPPPWYLQGPLHSD